MTKVTDPDLLAQLNGSSGTKVTDPALLAQLNGDSSDKSHDDMSYGAGTGYTRGGLPFKSTQEPLSPKHFINGAMMIPALGAEGAVLKGGELLENAATRAYPKVAQVLGEGKILPSLVNTGKAAVGGAVGGATYGAGTGGNVGENAALGTIGSVGGKAISSGVSKGYELWKNYIDRELPEVSNNQAVQGILKRFSKDQKGGGIGAQEALQIVDEARKSGKPMALADINGKNIKGLSGTVARSQGAGGEIANQFLSQRDKMASERLTQDVNKYLSSESGRQTSKALAEIRSVEGKPLFEEAMKGGSLAPLEAQFTKSFQNTAEAASGIQKEVGKASARVTSLQGKISQTGNNVYAQQSLKKEMESAQKELSAKQSQLATAKMEEAEAHQRLQQAQADGSANVPGAVWSPQIQRLLDLPIVQSGIKQGIKLERQNSAAEGRAFNSTEYAIVGTDKSGEPIVGKVPNMRLLASAKEGLDAILGKEEMRDQLTGKLTKEGVSVDKVRRSLLKELDEINPAYKKARESWAGHSDSMEAIRFGQRVFNENPHEIAEEIAQMTPSEREFAKLGVADMVRERILKTGFHGDEAKAIIKSDWAKMQLRPFFKNDEEFNSFTKAVTDERSMFESGVKMKGNSASAERLSDDAENMKENIGKFNAAQKLVRGHPVQAYQALWEAWDASKGRNEKLNEAMARILFNPNIPTDALKRPIALGEPKIGLGKKIAPYVGMGASQQLAPNSQ